MTAIARFYITFLSFIELDPTRPTHICKFSDPARPDPRVDPTRVQLFAPISKRRDPRDASLARYNAMAFALNYFRHRGYRRLILRAAVCQK